MSKHEPSLGATDEWYTPPYIFKALGCIFDEDVASPGASVVPWIPAKIHHTKTPSGLISHPWKGFIWMNPPYGGRNGLLPWLEKFIVHGNGIALVPDRTSAGWWQYAAGKAHKCLFINGKVKFLKPDGSLGGQPSNGSCLLAMGDRGVRALQEAKTAGLGIIL